MGRVPSEGSRKNNLLLALQPSSCLLWVSYIAVLLHSCFLHVAFLSLSVYQSACVQEDILRQCDFLLTALTSITLGARREAQLIYLLTLSSSWKYIVVPIFLSYIYSQVMLEIFVCFKVFYLLLFYIYWCFSLYLLAYSNLRGPKRV